LVSADKGYTPLNLSDNVISDIVEPNIPDTIANIKQKSLHGRYFKELEQPEINIQASHAWLKKSNIHPETEGFIFAIQDRVINTRNYKKHICGLQSIIDKCRICGTEGETIEHIISSCTVPRIFFSNLGRRLAIVAGSSVLGGVSERISQTRKTRR
jgi:hypothetical protein